MKIYKTRKLNRLPEIIERCTSPVYIVLENGEELPIEQKTGTMTLLEQYCREKDIPEVELNFSDMCDARRVLEYLIGA